MFLKNYSSNVPVSQSIARIEHVLLRCGVTSIEKEYAPGAESAKIVALTFKLQIPKGPLVQIRLPANEEAAIQALWVDYAGADISSNGQYCYGRKSKQRKEFIEQGTRTAWKIMQDWIEVQMSMIQLKQAELLQVFLPYCWDGESTFYNRMRDGGFTPLLGGPKSEAA